MKRTNVFLEPEQRAGLLLLARHRVTSLSIEIRNAIDAHLHAHRALLKNGAKLPKKIRIIAIKSTIK